MKRFLRNLPRFIFRFVLLFVLLSVLTVLLLRFINPSTTFTMVQRGLKAKQEKTTIKREWVPIERISKNAQLAAICGEDQQFVKHHGFDFTAIQSALLNNQRGGKIRGASTISQQTAKNVFLWEGRSYMRKGLEAWFTLLIETLWGKKRIMEVYLNVAETGKYCFGIEAAAKKYYQTSAYRLSASQAAGISSILPSPRKWSIYGYPATYRKRTILYSMMHYGITLDYLQ